MIDFQYARADGVADAVRRIAAADPALGRHFETAIRTGTLCSYVPDPRLPIDWSL